MSKVQLVTIKGCQSNINLRPELENLIETEKLDLEIEMILVPSPARATQMGLFGSPTIHTRRIAVVQVDSIEERI